MNHSSPMLDTLSQTQSTWVSEATAFYLKSAIFLTVTGVILYMGLAAKYPPLHDAMHSVRHALAIVPCH